MALDLCQDDSQWIACLEEGAQMYVGRGLRILFCNILVHCDPMNPQEMFDKFLDQMCADKLFRRQQSDMLATESRLKQLAKNDVLLEISSSLGQHSMTNTDCRIEEPDLEVDHEPINNSSEIDPDAEAFFTEHFDHLNNKINGILIANYYVYSAP